MTITYFVPTTDTPTGMDDYSPQVWADGTVKEIGWLTLDELLTLYPENTPAPTLEEISLDYQSRVQARLDTFARTLTYDSILSACTYATSTIEMYRIEGQYCVDARDATWAKAYELIQEMLPKVTSGEIAVPIWEDIEEQLPVLTWPKGSRGYVEAKSS